MTQESLDRIFAEVHKELSPANYEDLVAKIGDGLDSSREYSPSEITLLATNFAIGYAEDFLHRVLEKALIDGQ